MERFFEILIGCLITFGISHSIANADGPFAAFSTLREKLQSTRYPEWIRNGIECPICVSCYVGLAVAFCLNEGNLVAMWLSSLGFTAAVMSLSPPD